MGKSREGHKLPVSTALIIFFPYLKIIHGHLIVFLTLQGVLAALEGSRFVEILANAPITVSALKEDLDARGLSGQISAKIDVVGYTEFVNLTVTHASQMNW